MVDSMADNHLEVDHCQTLHMCSRTLKSSRLAALSRLCPVTRTRPHQLGIYWSLLRRFLPPRPGSLGNIITNSLSGFSWCHGCEPLIDALRLPLRT